MNAMARRIVNRACFYTYLVLITKQLSKVKQFKMIIVLKASTTCIALELKHNHKVTENHGN